MDLAVNIAIGSSAQIALFVAPLLVLLSFVFGPFPMPLVFNGFEVAALVLAVIIANRVTVEGESTGSRGSSCWPVPHPRVDVRVRLAGEALCAALIEYKAAMADSTASRRDRHPPRGLLQPH